MPPALLLASTSPYRRELLARLGVPFRACAPGVDEARGDDEPADRAVERLARDKAVAVACRYPAAVVVGSDQLAALDGSVLGKPGSVEATVAQLLRASGRQVDFFTGVAVARSAGAVVESRVVRTRVRFRPLDEERVRAYVARENPIDCAGGFKSEGLGVALFASIDGPDPSALVGLPLIELCTLLVAAGIDPLAPARG